MDNKDLLEVINRVLANGIRPNEHTMIQWKNLNVNPTFNTIPDGPIEFSMEGGALKMNGVTVYVKSSNEYAVLAGPKSNVVV